MLYKQYSVKFGIGGLKHVIILSLILVGQRTNDDIRNNVSQGVTSGLFLYVVGKRIPTEGS